MSNVVRSTVVAGLTGTLMVSAAWAGIGLAPVPTPSLPATGTAPTDAVRGAAAEPEQPAGQGGRAVNPVALGAGQLLVGAAKTSMAPRPDLADPKRFPGATWETDPATCKTLAPPAFQDLPKSLVNAADGIANPGSVWPENPNCIYMGGFGLGPVNPISSFEDLGLWVRSMAVSDGKQTIITTVVDGEGWLWDYKSKCADCGAKQIAAALGADPELQARGVTAASSILHTTHSHAAPDFIGGWGFVPNWYMAQITDAIKSTAKQAVLTMEAATLETGEEEARAYNSERRDTYRSAEEAQISWLRAVAVDSNGDQPGGGQADGEGADPADKPRVIATLGAYAAHPTTVGTNKGVASSDWPGLFAQRAEERFGGIGLHVMTGLGNMSASGGRAIGTKLADLLPEVGGGRPVDDTTVKISSTTVNGALTNVPLTTLGTAGVFDRKFATTPAAVSTGKTSTAPCVSASAQSVELPATAARIGDDVVLTAAPGEVFSNFTNTIKEKSPGRVSFPIGQANDALGYMPQSFEINPVGQQGLGFFAGGYFFVNYEDSYATDRCTGDLILEKTLTLLEDVKK